MSQSLRDTLPSTYGPLLSEHFDRPAVVEARATCDNCQMCDRGNAPPELLAAFFRPDTKCCTFFPSLPNFLVGAILSDDRPDMAEGRKRIQAHIETRLGSTPYWLGAPKKYEVLYRASSSSSFGRSALLRCPYLTDGGLCSIWRHREAVCSTFYCKFVNGSAGSTYWKAVKSYLCHVEGILARWSAKAVSKNVSEPPDTDQNKLTLNELEERPLEDALYNKYWAEWAGREAEFYVACYERVKGLDKAEFAKLVDEPARGKNLLDAMQRCYEALGAKPKLPERLELNPKMRVLPVLNGVVLTTPYNAYDSFSIEPELFDVLKRFKHGTTVDETRAHLRDEEGIEFEDELLTTFVTHSILVAPSEAGVCEPAPKAAAGAARTSLGRWAAKK